MSDDKKDGRVEWVEAYLKRELSEFEANAVVLICKTMRRGPYDFASTFRKAEWGYGRWVRFRIPGHGIATYDSDGLTALVIGAHDMCIRVELSACSPTHIEILMHQRDRREGRLYQRHPTIEEAIQQRR
jgi:hypothetical protein|tara:strand:- start:8510 stop:8896 length:387 start_codon:yes stop_codon:yes gene_type:complete